MRLSIQTIVFNAESVLPVGMLQKNIEQWLDIADEIIIVEGATRAVSSKFDGDTSDFTKDGRSTDNTLEILRRLAKEHSKIKLIVGEGFWDGKTEMCNAAAGIATGDFLWQVDSDEFYHEGDIPIILKLLESNPDAIHFYANHFWGGYNTIMDNNQPWGNDIPWKRVFRNEKGSKWLSHEPPEYLLANGSPCNSGKVITRDQTNKLGIKIYHYSYVCEKQITFKSKFFKNSKYIEFWENWKINNRTPILGSVTSPFLGDHPRIIKDLL